MLAAASASSLSNRSSLDHQRPEQALQNHISHHLSSAAQAAAAAAAAASSTTNGSVSGGGTAPGGGTGSIASKSSDPPRSAGSVDLSGVSVAKRPSTTSIVSHVSTSNASDLHPRAGMVGGGSDGTGGILVRHASINSHHAPSIGHNNGSPSVSGQAGSSPATTTAAGPSSSATPHGILKTNVPRMSPVSLATSNQNSSNGNSGSNQQQQNEGRSSLQQDGSQPRVSSSSSDDNIPPTSPAAGSINRLSKLIPVVRPVYGDGNGSGRKAKDYGIGGSLGSSLPSSSILSSSSRGKQDERLDMVSPTTRTILSRKNSEKKSAGSNSGGYEPPKDYKPERKRSEGNAVMAAMSNISSNISSTLRTRRNTINAARPSLLPVPTSSSNPNTPSPKSKTPTSGFFPSGRPKSKTPNSLLPSMASMGLSNRSAAAAAANQKAAGSSAGSTRSSGATTAVHTETIPTPATAHRTSTTSAKDSGSKQSSSNRTSVFGRSNQSDVSNTVSSQNSSQNLMQQTNAGTNALPHKILTRSLTTGGGSTATNSASPSSGGSTAFSSQPPSSTTSKPPNTATSLTNRRSMAQSSPNLIRSPTAPGPTPSLKLPLTPEATMHYYRDLLTPYEQREVFDFPDVWFAGAAGVEKVGSKNRPTGADSSSANSQEKSADKGGDDGGIYNSGYDDARGDYYLTYHDHVAYRYEIISLLGKGSFGQVVKCYDHRHKVHVALKIIRNKKRFEKQGVVEVKVLDRLRQEDSGNCYNIIHMQDHFYFRGHLCITFELLGINLYEWLKAGGFRGINLSVIRSFAIQILQCMDLLNRCRIVHCDLKPENVLLRELAFLQPGRGDLHGGASTGGWDPAAAGSGGGGEPGVGDLYGIKVIDFGSSCFESEKVYTYVQSRFYRSPEVILGISYNMSIDMWSLGCILAEMYTGYPLFPGENEQEQLACIMEVKGVPPESLIERGSRRKLFFDAGGVPRIMPNSRGKKRRPNAKTLTGVLRGADPLFVDFVSRCLEWDPDTRMTPLEALSHEWVRDYIPRNYPFPTRSLPSSSSANAASALNRASIASGRTNSYAAATIGDGSKYLLASGRKYQIPPPANLGSIPFSTTAVNNAGSSSGGVTISRSKTMPRPEQSSFHRSQSQYQQSSQQQQQPQYQSQQYSQQSSFITSSQQSGFSLQQQHVHSSGTAAGTSGSTRARLSVINPSSGQQHANHIHNHQQQSQSLPSSASSTSRAVANTSNAELPPISSYNGNNGNGKPPTGLSQQQGIQGFGYHSQQRQSNRYSVGPPGSQAGGASPGGKKSGGGGSGVWRA